MVGLVVVKSSVEEEEEALLMRERRWVGDMRGSVAIVRGVDMVAGGNTERWEIGCEVCFDGDMWYRVWIRGEIVLLKTIRRRERLS